MLLELVGIIIDHLHDDKTALKSCCLTCHAWISSCQYHLFASISLSLGSQPDRTLLAWSRTFPSISDSPSRYVKTLKIHGSTSIRQFVSQFNDDGLVPHFKSFSQVQVLSLDQVEIGPVEESSFEHLTYTLRSLELFRCQDLSTVNLLHLICLFPNLDDVTCVHCMGPPTPSGCIVKPKFSPRLRGILELRGYCNLDHTFVKGILDGSNGVNFRSLITTCNYDEGLSMLLSRCASTMETLEFRCGKPLAAPHNLEHLTCLRQVVLITHFRPSISWIPALLSSIRSTKLNDVTFKFKIVGLDWFHQGPEWELVDDALIQLMERVDGALKVNVEVDRRESAAKDEWYKKLTQYLPRVGERDILEVRVRPDGASSW